MLVIHRPTSMNLNQMKKEWETWKEQALKLRKATQLVSMVTCRLYPDDVMERERKGRATKKDKETLEVWIFILNVSKKADGSYEWTKR